MARSKALFYVVLLAAYGLFLGLGAWVFMLLERPCEEDVRRALSAAHDRFLAEHGCLTEAALEAFLGQVLDARALGVSVLRNATGGLHWDLVSSFFFVSTTLTTTGYGRPAPISAGGKAFCLLYLVFGVPFSLCLLSITCQNLLILIHDKPIRYLRLHFGFSNNVVTWLYAGVFIGLLTCLFLLIPACIFTLIEGSWSYLDALYFCFISLTTIGLGDYVPGEQADQRLPILYKLCTTGYLLIGLVAMILVLETLKRLFKLNHNLNIFLLTNGNDEGGKETEPLIPPFSEISVFPSKSEEKARRRLPHSLSPQSESLYGSVYAAHDS